MKSTPITVLLALLVALPAAGGDFVHAKKVTAQMVVDAIRNPQDGPRAMEHYEAYGYLRGTKDNVNVEWCPPAGLPNLEIDGEIVGYLAKLPAAARQGVAGPHIAAALRAKFPCPRRKE